MTIAFQAAEFPPDEITPESASAPEPTPVDGELTCAVCGKPLTYAGRGRKPKFCDDHRTGNGARKAGMGTAPARATKNEKMRRELTSTLGLIGVGLMAVEPYDGLVVLDRAEATVDALMDVAEHNPRVRKVLESMIEVSVWGALGAAVAGMAAPIAAHHGILPIPSDAMEKQFLSKDAQTRLARMRAANSPREEDETVNRFRETVSGMSDG
jgi:hypothetical protein